VDRSNKPQRWRSWPQQYSKSQRENIDLRDWNKHHVSCLSPGKANKSKEELLPFLKSGSLSTHRCCYLHIRPDTQTRESFSAGESVWTEFVSTWKGAGELNARSVSDSLQVEAKHLHTATMVRVNGNFLRTVSCLVSRYFLPKNNTWGLSSLHLLHLRTH
jgi:hypothetical protein